jgi:hypothetical protein
MDLKVGLNVSFDNMQGWKGKREKEVLLTGFSNVLFRQFICCHRPHALNDRSVVTAIKLVLSS